jgi:hypothetical protein
VPQLQSRIFWLLVLIGHGVVAAAWWAMMPGGFAVDHPRFWVNQVAPPAMILLCAAVIFAGYRERYGVVRAAIVMLAAMWLAIAISARTTFPISLRTRFWIPLLFFACILVAAFAPALRKTRWPKLTTATAVVIGLALGAWLPRTQRADEASTQPINIATSALATTTLPTFEIQPLTRSLQGFDVTPSSGIVTLRRGRYTLAIQPMLEFRSRSPDRFWTIFAPAADRTGPSRLLDGFLDRGSGVWMSYRDDDRSFLTVDQAGDGWGANIEAISMLPRPIYTHLNTFCDFQFVGHSKLSVTFSPCPDKPIEVMHQDYPVGDPARFAYLDANGTFRIVQASSGEKGPYTTLAEGKMSRDDSLVMILSNKSDQIARIELLDWARQASTATSPTAGWRVPVNAIEFSRDTEVESSVASFFVTLAGTSVGRGWDSVGHAAGTYRSRVRAGWVE